MKRRQRKIKTGKYGLFRYYCPICERSHIIYSMDGDLKGWCKHAFGVKASKNGEFTWKNDIKCTEKNGLNITISDQMRVLMKPTPKELMTDEIEEPSTIKFEEMVREALENA